jgi:hypothetical protein
MADIIYRCYDNTEHKVNEVHQIEINIEGETFYVIPWGDGVRIIANKKTALEPAFNGVTVYVEQTQQKPKHKYSFEFSTDGNGLTIKKKKTIKHEQLIYQLTTGNARHIRCTNG